MCVFIYTHMELSGPGLGELNTSSELLSAGREPGRSLNGSPCLGNGNAVDMEVPCVMNKKQPIFLPGLCES